jgi:sigma-B regulation protein RsbU (phosphoserine phosphatase)
MEPGSVLLMYTDGITEAANQAGEMFGVERLRRLLASRAWNSARLLVERVFSDVRAFSNAEPPTDDQTVVAVVRDS